MQWHWLIPHITIQIVEISLILYVWLSVFIKSNGTLPWWMKLAIVAMVFNHTYFAIHRIVMLSSLSGYLSVNSLEVSFMVGDFTMGLAAAAWWVFKDNWIRMRNKHPDQEQD